MSFTSFFKYSIIFFNFFNTPICYQKYIDKILAKKLDIFINIYLKNIWFYVKD